MSFSSDIRAFAATIPKRKKCSHNEEAVKQSLILPFLSVLGYDTADTCLLSPECDITISNSDAKKVDYVLHVHQQPAMLIECKHKALSRTHVEQLEEYFNSSTIRLGMLTNGTEYRFYSDVEHIGKMDKKPFLTADLLNLMGTDFKWLHLFTRNVFTEEAVLRQIPHILDVQTTEEDRAGWRMIKTMLQPHVSHERVSLIQTKNYGSIVLDDQRNKRICLLWLNGREKRVSLFDTGTERKVSIQSLDDLHQHATSFIAMVAKYTV